MLGGGFGHAEDEVNSGSGEAGFCRLIIFAMKLVHLSRSIPATYSITHNKTGALLTRP